MTLHYYFLLSILLCTQSFFWQWLDFQGKNAHSVYKQYMSPTRIVLGFPSMHSKKISIVPTCEEGQHVNVSTWLTHYHAKHLESIKVVQKGVYTLNCLLSVTETWQLQQEDIHLHTRCSFAYYYYYHHHISSPSSIHNKIYGLADKAVDQPLGLSVNTPL